MNVLEINIDADTGISKNEENKMNIIIEYLKRSELFKKDWIFRSLYMQKWRYSRLFKKNQNINIKNID